MTQNQANTSMVDSESAEDLISSFDEHYEVIQISLNRLMHNASDSDLINTTFRSIHTIKGNASMVQIQPLVDYTHAVEEAIGAMRAGYFVASQKLCELLLTSIDRLRDLHNKYLFNKEICFIDELEIANAFKAIAIARSPEEVDQYCEQLTRIFSPEPVADIIQQNHNSAMVLNTELDINIQNMSQHQSYLEIDEHQKEDLIFFRILSIQVDAQNDFWDKRTDLILYLALKTLSMSDKDIDRVQLTAAVYMHDAGMAFVAENIVNKNTRLNTLEAKKLQQHPVWGYNMLKRMKGWEPASEMILAHHERIDGKGYPFKTMGTEINEGAKLLAILDAYFAMTHLRADRSHRRSILRAISEINACIDTQFCSYWVELFNQVIRKEVKQGLI